MIAIEVLHEIDRPSSLPSFLMAQDLPEGERVEVAIEVMSYNIF